MADIKHKRKCRNYISALVAIYKTGAALENFTKQGLSSVHNHIKQTVGNLPPCLNQCSQNNRDTNRWCHTCARWKIELEHFIPRGIRRNWQGRKSWCWPNSAQDIAEVFALPDFQNWNINLTDISSIFNIWNRCSQFQRPIVKMLEPLKESRNKLIRITENMKLTNAKKKLIFQQIGNVVNQPDVRKTMPNHADFLQTLRELKKGRLFEDDIKGSLQAIGMHSAEIKAKLDTFSLTLEYSNRAFTLQNEMLKRFEKTYLISSCIFTSCIVLIFAVLYNFNQTYVNQQCLGLSVHPSQPRLDDNSHNRTESQNGCLPEMFEVMHYPHISLIEYLDHHQNFVGRKWLTELIERKLLNANETSRGIIIEAGMGYGKSAFLKHIICSSDNSSGSIIRSRLVAFHVCRFDVLTSKEMFVFVFRLINMMSSQLPFLHDAIKVRVDIFDKDMCRYDPYGCLDQCLIIPLKNISYTGSTPVIIIIDGLDECFDNSKGVNEILHLLKDRLYRFPSWVKFLVSSRPEKRLDYLTTDLEIVKLNDDASENIKDIDMYIESFNLNTSIKIPNMVRGVNVSIFFLISYFKRNERTENIKEGESFQGSLNEFYLNQFQRVFTLNPEKKFKDSKLILEVISSSFQSPSKDEMWYILSNATSMTLKQFNINFQLLNNFFRNIGSEIHLFHLSFQEWLLSEKNVDFSIDIENGHKLNALYLFQRIERGNYELDIVDLVSHVDLSLSEALRQRFLNIPNYTLIELGRNEDVYPLLRLARNRDSFEAANLLLSQFKNYEVRNSDNETALYVAASRGHVNTLKALIYKGANVNFRTNSFSKIINFDNAALVAFEHQHWDYGIMDIAAQNGHVNVVDYLLENNNNLFDYPMAKYNSMKLLPIHLACKKGHTAIVKAFHSKHKWMLDWQCLYYASEIGRSCLVKYILENKIKDGCPKCEPYINWIEESQLRVQGKFFHSNILGDRNISYILNDDWVNITCESALHVAVKENKLDVVKILTRQTNHAVFCYDRGGRTPVLSAIQYGFREIVEHFRSSKFLTGNESCAEIRPLNDSFKLHENEIARLEMQFCENCMSIPHILAKYNHFSLSKMLTSKGITLNWLSKDSDGCFPIHKAACHGSLEMLKYLLEKQAIQAEKLECLNGSITLHSAVECRSVKSSELILINFQKYTRESKDVKLARVKLAMKTNYGIELAKHYEEIETSVSKLISLLITKDSDVTVKDAIGRNILHYAIEQGHFEVVAHFFKTYKKESKQLLRSKDNDNRTPLLYALFTFKPLSQYFLSYQFFGVDATSFLFDDPLNRMTPKEYVLLLTLDFMTQSNIPFVYQDVFRQFVKKRCLHVVIFLLEKNHCLLRDPVTHSSIIKHDNHGLQALALYLISMKQAVSGLVDKSPLHPLFSCSTCNEFINKYHAHDHALNYLKISSLIRILGLNNLNNFIQKFIFHKSLSYLMSNCYDKDGFNLLERAIQGGSPELVRHLSVIGVQSVLDKEKLIEMALNGLKYRHENSYITDIRVAEKVNLKLSFLKYEVIMRAFNSREFQDLNILSLITLFQMKTEYFHGQVSMKRIVRDELVSHLIVTYRHVIPRQKMCLNFFKRFSIIHRLALEGLNNSIRHSVKFWGREILNCKNTDDFTSLYLSKVFQYDDMANFIEAQGMSFVAPSKTAESYFRFKLLYRFKFSRHEKKHIQCIMSYTKIVPNTTYKKIKAYTCARNVIHTIKSKQFRKTMKEFKWKLAFYIEINSWRTLMIQFLKKLGVNLKSFLYVTDSFEYFAPTVEYAKTVYDLEKIGKGSMVYDRNLANLIQLANAENRTCNYLRISYKKTLLILKEEASQCMHNCSLKDIVLQEFYMIINDISKYGWNTFNCSEIESSCLERRVLLDFNKLVRKTFYHLRLLILMQATSIKNAHYVPFLAKDLNFSQILQNHNKWLRFYHRYSYMNELQTSPIFKESWVYNRNINRLSRYINGIMNSLQFYEWNRNADKLFDLYLTSQ